LVTYHIGVAMAQQKTGLVFRSALATPEMAKRIERKFPKPHEQLAIAQQIHAEVLPVVEGVTQP
jgi:hypothetical protein